uniref:Ig-like domain-containing protein n=1 Tax=Methanobrevibacter sp. TaxID=66852 RepID=UPI003864D2B4
LVSIIDGKAVYVIKNLTFGRWEVTAFYANGIFNSTSQKTSFEVEKLNPTIVLDIVEAFVGQTERIVARADGLKGNITFVVDDHGHDVGIIDGEASIFLSNLDGGRHTLKVIYSGDDSHKNATLECEFYIKTQETDIVISVNETSYGETITVVARVDGNAGGVMRFSVDGLCATSAIEGGIATWSFGGLDVGRYTIMADYSGDNQFISASKSADFRITRAQSTIEVYVDDVVLDENIRIYARVSPNATGKVSFRMVDYYSPRDKDVVNSTASWLIAPLMNGQYTIIATYRGDSNYYSSTTTYILNVSQTRSVLTVEANDVSKSDNVVIKITLMSRSGEYITDSVNVQIGSKSYRINVRNGAGTLNLGRLAPGNYTVQASYGGNKNYSSSKASCQFEVSDSQIESILTCENVTKYYGSDVKFVISLTNAKNKALSYQTVYITVKGVETAYISDEDGKIYIDINNTLEKYDVYGEFRGSDTYYPSNATGTIEVLSTVQSEDVVKLYGSGVQYFAIFKDFNGKALSNADVMFRIAGKLYNYTTFPNGIVRLNINLSPGTYEIVAMNPLTGENATNTLTIYNILMENSDVANYFGANSVYRVRAFGNDGKPVEGGNMVTFYVDGKTYHIKTDSNGYATLSVRLNPKQYVITAEFNGTRVSNIITVKPVLTTKITSSKKSKKTKFSAKLLDTNGNPLKGKKITFKIKGKKYKAKTNKKGIASIKIKLKLKKGTYKIYTIYGKSKVINKIKVK